MSKWLASLAVLGSLAVPQVIAASTPAPLTVQATVNAICSLHGSYVMDFGNISDLSGYIYTPFATRSNGISVACTSGVNYYWTVDLGQNASGNQRRMVSGSGDYLPYQIVNYGYPIDDIPIHGGSGLGEDYAHSQVLGAIYAFIPAGTAMPSPGTYTDTVMLTVTY